MRLSQWLKSNRGSSLTMMILIITILSLLAGGIMLVTMSNLNMSLMYGDVNRAYFAAEAGVEQVARALDEKVGVMQEAARQHASEFIKNRLKPGDEYYNGDGTLRDDLVQSGFEEVKAAFEQSYFAWLKDQELSTTFSTVHEYPVELIQSLLGPGSTLDIQSEKVYKDLENKGGRVVFESAIYNTENCQLTVTVKGIYNDYKKTIEATFNLVPEKSPYKTVIKADVRRNPLYDRKAIVTMGNVIAAEGKTSVKGDVLSFGTIPASNGQEDRSAQWYRYGGILAGMCPEVWDMSNEFGFDASSLGRRSNGSINIDGSASTYAYIHSLYGTGSMFSDISISGNTFARSVKSEPGANYSTLDFQDVYTTDNLQVDSNNSTVTVNGSYYGFIEGGSMLQGIETDPTSFDYKRSSSIIVNGDSILWLKGDMYIGGSSFFKYYRDDTDNTKTYMTGLAAAKSGNRIVDAFKEGISSLFWYTPSEGYTEVQPSFHLYGGENLISGRSNSQDEGYFPIGNRAMHFKKLWETDEEFSNYINTMNIRISKVSPEGKLYGYSNGAIAANGKIYGPDDFVGGHDPVNFAGKYEKCKSLYLESLQVFLPANYSQENVDFNRIPTVKPLDNYINTDFVGEGKVRADEPYVIQDKGFIYYTPGDVHIKYEDRGNGVKWYIGANEMPLTQNLIKGIIYAAGNIYLDSRGAESFNFTGMLMAEKNIIFQGSSDKNIRFDILTVLDLLNSDANAGGLFRANLYDIPHTQDEKLVSQRIAQKNIAIVSWQEK